MAWACKNCQQRRGCCTCRRNAYMRAFGQRPEQRQKRLARYAQMPRLRKRDYHLKRTFGITSLLFDALVEKQHGRCAICDRDEETLRAARTRKYQWLYVDHDHLTGKIRGLLCNDCNAGLGLLADSLQRAKAVVRYLEISAA